MSVFRPVAAPDPAALTAECLVGCRLTGIDATSAPNYWVFHFDGRPTLGVGALWRLVSSQGIAVCSSDHGQLFGLPEPVDAVGRLSAAIGDRLVRRAVWMELTGDLIVDFGSGLRLEVIVDSTGYESWIVYKPDGTQLVGTGGGRVTLCAVDQAG